jgi:hypothetical protein
MGPEEMKFNQKKLYTYNVQDGDKFLVDAKWCLRVIFRSYDSTSTTKVLPNLGMREKDFCE